MAKTPTKLPKQEPKNPVAKNASAAIGGGAAGRMVNKAKRDSSGATRGQKHKNKAMELSEGLPNDAETQVTELSRDTLKSYVPKRIEKIQSIPNQKTPRKEFKKAAQNVKKDIPRAMSKLKDPSYGKQKPRGVAEGKDVYIESLNRKLNKLIK